MAENLKTPEENQQEFDKLPQEEQHRLVEDNQEDANKMKEMVEDGEALDYEEAEKLIDVEKILDMPIYFGSLGHFQKNALAEGFGKDIDSIETSNLTKIEEDFMQLISNARLRYMATRRDSNGRYTKPTENEMENVKARSDIILSMVINLMGAAKENRLQEVIKVADIVSSIDSEIENKIEDIETKTALRNVLRKLYFLPDAPNPELVDKFSKGNYTDTVNDYLKTQGIDPSLFENLSTEKWAQLIMEKTGGK